MNIKQLDEYCIKNNKIIVVNDGKLVGFKGVGENE